LWNLKTGDVLVELTFPSTADLADGVVDIKRWTGGATANVPAEDLLLDPSWTLVPAGGGTLPAYTAFNVAYNKTKSPNDDDEPGFDGVDMATGQLAEMAIDIKAVFGQGCGLRRTLAAISTASASPNGNDDLKDFVSPTTILTASIELGVTLSESCDEGFNWAASAKLGSDDLIGDPDIDLVIQYNCGSGVHEIAVTQTTGFEPVVGGGSCTAKLVARNGTGRLTSCDAESKPDNANAYPPLDVTAALAQANCGDDFTYDATPSGGSPPYAFSWTFTGPSAIASSSQEDGSAGITGAGTVNGAVTVTDSRFAALGCSDGDNNDTPVYSSLVASLTATPGDLACFDSDIPVTATMSGGSGAYTLNWNLTDEDGTNDATTSCSDGLGLSPTYCGFNLGGAVCAKAKLELSVSDPVCAQAVYAGGVGAERTSKVTVGALASP
jgi:hypothetical protein